MTKFNFRIYYDNLQDALLDFGSEITDIDYNGMFVKFENNGYTRFKAKVLPDGRLQRMITCSNR